MSHRPNGEPSTERVAKRLDRADAARFPARDSHLEAGKSSPVCRLYGSETHGRSSTPGDHQ
ncbi:hypothetical protein EA472_17085 [Natrarchaeobius oligotrophus]|uniref:Uncharacterized protein n=1 Tax=Natrarchaeobius chitinivorans TaxID=1679083 RepID=A0A3N6NHV9_NATCH|nr:hypothetical protein EA472_17085 [Natrarchaeobius chitinivorans]